MEKSGYAPHAIRGAPARDSAQAIRNDTTPPRPASGGNTLEKTVGAFTHAPGVTASKLALPAPGAGQLPRPHLVEAMTAAHHARLILIRAGAGFGKTTLMQQYAARCREAGHTLVWLRLDAADNDLQRFLLHLDAGLRGASLATGTGDAGNDAAARIIERIAGHTAPLSLMFDDFETIQSEIVLNFTRRIIDALPPGSRLVIASRATPDLGIGRIRARAELLDISPASLRFSLAETTRFIRDKCRLALRDAEIDTLYRCTEGWAAAIYLATLSLRTRSDHAAFVASFSGSNLELADYLAEDILARQSSECRSFLLETSVLPQLSAELCDAVRQRTDSREMLDYLERANLFLLPLDEARNWYRYHPLFSSFLRHRLQLAEPGRDRELHAAAARWLIDAKRPVPAIEHLLEAGHTDAALALIDACTPQLLRAGRVRLLMRWFDRVGPTSANAHGRTGLTRAWVLLINSRYDEAMRTVEHLLADSVGHAHHAELALEAEAVRAMLLALTGEVEACLASGAATLDRLPDETGYAYYNLAHTLAYSYIATHRYDEARSVISRALQRTHARRQGHTHAVAEALEGIIDLAQGRLGTALARLEAVLAPSWNTGESQVEGGRLSLDTVRALALYEADALEEAGRLLDTALPLARSNSPPDAMILCHVLSARLARSRGDHEQWQRLLAELEQIGRQVMSSRAICSAWLERARVATLERRLDAARQALHTAMLHAAWERPGVSFHANDTDLPALAQIRLALAEGAFTRAREQIAAARELAQLHLRYRRMLTLRLLNALALAGLGRQTEAFDEIGEAMRMASHEGFLRPFIDEGEPLAALVRAWAQAQARRFNALGVMPRFVDTLLARLPAPATAQTPNAQAADAPAETLTARELDVLRMLADGHRNRVIAEKLFVSELTVKSHLRNINAKLSAQNRTQAVAIARSLGLL